MKQLFSLCLVLAVCLVSACGKATSNAPETATNASVTYSPPTQTASDNSDTSPTLQPAQNETAFNLVILGDSVTAGYGLRDQLLLTNGLQTALRERGQDIVIINAGVSGDRMREGAARFDWSVGPEADGVLIALGGNDLLGGIDPQRTKEYLNTMLAKAKARNLWIAIAALPAPGNATPDFAEEFNSLFTELSTAYCAPLYPNFLMGVMGNPALNQSDGIHPTPEGVQVLLKALVPWLDAALKGMHNPCP